MIGRSLSLAPVHRRRGPAFAPRSVGLVALCALLTLLVNATGCSSLRERLALSAGNKLYKAQNYEGAIAEYRKILAIDPENWDGNYMVAVSYVALYHPGSTHPKDVEFSAKAIEACDKLLKLKAPDDATRDKVRGFYLTLLQQTDQKDKASGFFDEIIATDPNNLELLAQAAQFNAKNGRFEKALELYQHRAELDPKNKQAWYTLGVLCWERSNKGGTLVSNTERDALAQHGLEALAKALAIDPEYSEALLYTNLLYREKAKVLVDTGDLAGAQAAIATADDYQKKALVIMNKMRGTTTAPPKAPAPTPAGARG